MTSNVTRFGDVVAPTPIDVGQMLRHLQILHGGGEGLGDVVFAFLNPHEKPRQFGVDSDFEGMTGAAEMVQPLVDAGFGAYVSVGRFRAGRERMRAKADVVCLSGVVIDLDVKPGALAAEEVDEVLRALPLPTLVVGSGSGGAHAYWLLGAPAVGEDVERLHRVGLGWRDCVAEVAAEVVGRKVVVDDVGDVSRVLRLAGTWRHPKRGETGGAGPVVLRWAEGPRYGLEQLEALLPPGVLERERRPAVASVGGAGVVGGVVDEGWVGGVVRKTVAELAAGEMGGRNAALNRAAYTLGGLGAHGWLEMDAALELLVMGACVQNGLVDEDGLEACRATFESGWVSGLADPIVAPVRRGVSNGGGVAEKRHLTDDGNALRLIDQHGTGLRHVAARGSWLVWDGCRWCWDDTSAALSLARETIRGIYTEASQEADPDRRTLIAKHAGASEAASRVAGMLMLAKGDRRTAIRVDQLDTDPWLLNTPGGTIDLRTGVVKEWDPRDLLTMTTAVAADPSAGCPRWERFLGEVTCGDAELAYYLQLWAGYSLTGVCSEQAMLFCWGQGSNGKGVFVNTLRKLLGGYGHMAVSDLLLSSRGAPHKTRLAELVGKRLVVVSEVKGNETFDEALFQQLTGEDPITANYMRQDNFTFTPTFKLLMMANHKPKVSNSTHAFWRRMRLVPFMATFDGVGKDPLLGDRLVAEEGSGILAWAIRGCLAWAQQGMTQPSAVTRAVDAYRDAEDITSQFFEDRCVLAPNAWTAWSVLWESYDLWATGQMIEPRQRESQKSFRAKLEGLGCYPGRDATGHTRGWHGVHTAIPGVGTVRQIPTSNGNSY